MDFNEEFNFLQGNDACSRARCSFDEVCEGCRFARKQLLTALLFVSSIPKVLCLSFVSPFRHGFSSHVCACRILARRACESSMSHYRVVNSDKRIYLTERVRQMTLERRISVFNKQATSIYLDEIYLDEKLFINDSIRAKVADTPFRFNTRTQDIERNEINFEKNVLISYSFLCLSLFEKILCCYYTISRYSSAAEEETRERRAIISLLQTTNDFNCPRTRTIFHTKPEPKADSLEESTPRVCS